MAGVVVCVCATGPPYLHFVRIMCKEGPGPTKEGVVATQYSFMPSVTCMGDFEYDDGWAASVGIVDVVN